MKYFIVCALTALSFVVFAGKGFRDPQGRVYESRPKFVSYMTNPTDAHLVSNGWEIVTVDYVQQVVTNTRPAFSNEYAAALIAQQYLSAEEQALPALQRVAAFKNNSRAAVRGNGSIDTRFAALADGMDAKQYLEDAVSLGGGPADPNYLKPSFLRTNTVRVVTP